MSDFSQGPNWWQASDGKWYPPAYSAPAAAQYPPSSRSTNGLAIASMVLGIIWLYWIGSILALIFGYKARAQIRDRGEAGEGMAIAGIVLGWIGVGFFVLFVVIGGLASAYGPAD